MNRVRDLSYDDLVNIVEVIIDSIKDNEKDMAEFATDVGQSLIDYDLIK